MKNKKNLMMMIPLVLIVVLVLIIIFKDDKEVVPTSETELSDIANYNEYFGITRLINDYLNEDSKSSEENTYYITDLKTIKLKKNTYYFICGDKEIYDYKTTKVSLLENDCYFINAYLVDQKYHIEKINSINEYYQNNKFYDNVSVSDNRYLYSYNNLSIGDDYILAYYINYFKDLLFVNYNKAYNMLDSSYKNKFNGIDDFNNQREKIYNSLSLTITDYSIKGDDGNRTLKAVINEGPIITFKEKGFLNYTVSIENYE